jgi:hydrogenase expression/formation protein HypE
MNRFTNEKKLQKIMDTIILSHGNGGKQSHNLIRKLFVQKFGMPDPLTDSAILKASGLQLAFTTDSYVVDPVFFPGGNIGKLAVCGTVNDLAVSGAVPAYISASFIIEEGFPYRDLEMIVSSMAEEAYLAGVSIVTGDTKVVGKGKCDKIFINTSGIGFIQPEFADISSAKKVFPGDKLIINGNLADHAMAVMAARNELSFSSSVVSDCASLNHLIQKILQKKLEVKFMRDVTRGGLATVLNELAGMTGMGILVQESLIPVAEQVRGLCEILGFDPLHMANEGKVLIVVSDGDAPEVLEILKSDPLGTNSRIIGEITSSNDMTSPPAPLQYGEGCEPKQELLLRQMSFPHCARKNWVNSTNDSRVVLSTVAGGKRLLDMLSGTQLPRIC